jgi:hypothetical protein
LAAREEDARARCEVLRPDFVRELEPAGSKGCFKSLPTVAELDPVMVRRNRELIDGRRKPASAAPEKREKRA